MHKHLYKDKMPSSIQACFTASTLYSNMTTSNKILVFRVLCQSLEELKRVRSDSTPQEQLARVQSLFLYQIIGLFDGDVSLRSNADRNMLLLQDWLDELCKIRENLTTSESMNNLKPPTSWEVCKYILPSFHVSDSKSGGYFLSLFGEQSSSRMPSLVCGV